MRCQCFHHDIMGLIHKSTVPAPRFWDTKKTEPSSAFSVSDERRTLRSGRNLVPGYLLSPPRGGTQFWSNCFLLPGGTQFRGYRFLLLGGTQFRGDCFLLSGRNSVPGYLLPPPRRNPVPDTSPDERRTLHSGRNSVPGCYFLLPGRNSVPGVSAFSSQDGTQFQGYRFLLLGGTQFQGYRFLLPGRNSVPGCCFLLPGRNSVPGLSLPPPRVELSSGAIAFSYQDGTQFRGICFLLPGGTPFRIPHLMSAGLYDQDGTQFQGYRFLLPGRNSVPGLSLSSPRRNSVPGYLLPPPKAELSSGAICFLLPGGTQFRGIAFSS